MTGTVGIVDFRYEYTNDATCRIHGRSREETIGRNFLELLPALRETEIFEGYLRTAETGEPLVKDNVAVAGPVGAIEFPVSYFDIRAVRLGDGLAVRFMDVTDRKFHEESQAWLASFPELNPSPVLEVDLEGNLHYVNPAARKLFPEIEKEGMSHWWLAGARAVLEQFRQGRTETVTRTVAIGSRHYHQNISYFEHLRRVRVYGIDITERIEAEDALRKSEERLRRAQEIAHLGSWELDLERNELTWSDEVYRIFGLRPQQHGATYEAFLDSVHPDDRQKVDDAYSGSLRDNRDSYEIEHRVVRPDGEIRYVHERCEHIRGNGGGIVRSVGMVHDITERKQAEEALWESKERLALAASGTRIGIFDRNLKTSEIAATEQNIRLLGMDLPTTSSILPPPLLPNATRIAIGQNVSILKTCPGSRRRWTDAWRNTRHSNPSTGLSGPTAAFTGWPIAGCSNTTTKTCLPGLSVSSWTSPIASGPRSSCRRCWKKRMCSCGSCRTGPRTTCRSSFRLLGIQASKSKDEKMAEALSDAQDRVRTMALVYEKLHRSGSVSSLNAKKYVEELSTTFLHAHRGIGGRSKRSWIWRRWRSRTTRPFPWG